VPLRADDPDRHLLRLRADAEIEALGLVDLVDAQLSGSAHVLLVHIVRHEAGAWPARTERSWRDRREGLRLRSGGANVPVPLVLNVLPAKRVAAVWGFVAVRSAVEALASWG
jgi:hypothetical protein